MQHIRGEFRPVPASTTVTIRDIVEEHRISSRALESLFSEEAYLVRISAYNFVRQVSSPL